MPKFELIINGSATSLDVPADMPLLWALRDTLGLVGTKFGCGIAQCGACTVHVDGTPLRACSVPAASLAGRRITTIEGLAETDRLHPLQQAWIDLDVAQCGYCQAGQIMSAAALLEANPSPSDQEIEQAMQGNYCRCGTYNRIRSAIKQAGQRMAQYSAPPHRTVEDLAYDATRSPSQVENRA